MDNKDRLAKLDRIEQGNRERARLHLQRAREQGKKQISAILDPDVYQELCRRRDASHQAGKPLTMGQVIGQAVFPPGKTVKPEPVNSNVNINKSKQEPSQVNWDEWHELVKEIGPGEALIPDRDRLVLWLCEACPGPKYSKARVGALNNAGILFKGGTWDTKQFSDQRVSAKKRAKKKVPR